MNFVRRLSTGILLVFIFILAGCAQPAPQPSGISDNTSATQNYMLFPIYTVVEGQNLFGYIDKQGNIVIEPHYTSARDFSEGLAPVQVENGSTGSWGFINLDGVEVIEPIYASVGDFHEGLAAVATHPENSDSPLWGFIDKQGNVVVDIKWQEVHNFSDSRAFVYQDGVSHFIDPSGAIVIDNAEGLMDFMDGLSM